MKYRIKTITYKDGSVKYTVEYNYWIFFWNYFRNWINSNYFFNEIIYYTTREEAIQEIDKDYNLRQSFAIKSIEIEYINK